jgi:hypothetical protein
MQSFFCKPSSSFYVTTGGCEQRPNGATGSLERELGAQYAQVQHDGTGQNKILLVVHDT